MLNGTPTQLGVVHGRTQNLVGFDEFTYSTTYDNGGGNGAFIRQFLNDADYDGVPDNVDNCTPQNIRICQYDISRCYNPEQTDLDNDGIGDVCDNCAPTVCDRRGWPRPACANAAQTDGDGDETGDVCDSCPLTRNGSGFLTTSDQFLDGDNDGVGDACDNCFKPNGYRACASTGDCNGLGCLSPSALGRCAFPSQNLGAACGSGDECPGGTCRFAVPNGRCVVQLDDIDGDGLGDGCDSCPTISNANLQANSNDTAEMREAVSPLGDVCDPVPLTISRPIVGDASGLGSADDHTSFVTSYGLGQTGEVARMNATAGFHHCGECLNTSDGTYVNRDFCLRGLCAPRADAFVSNDEQWKRVTTATILRFGFRGQVPPPLFDVPTLDQVKLRTFTTEVHCVDSFLHPTSPSESCRIGADQEILRWYHVSDIAAGRIPSFNGTTAGIWWSHVIAGSGSVTSASTRDRANPLRDSYDFVTTPLGNLPAPPPPVPSHVPCASNLCMPHVPEPPDPGKRFNSYEPNPGLLAQAPVVSRILAGPNNTFVAVGTKTDTPVDLAPVLSPGVRALLARTDLAWLGAVEPGSRLRQSPSSARTVVMPSEWRQAFDHPILLIHQGGQLLTSGEVKAPAPDLPHFVPGDRDGSRALLAGLEAAVYLVGGHRADGTPTGEVWRYGIVDGAWKHILLPAQGVPQPRVGDVRALTYDDRGKRIVVVDEPTQAPRHGPPRLMADRMRIILLDIAADELRVLGTIRRTGALERVSLVAQDDGSFVLVGQRRGVSGWAAFRFRIDGGHIVWRGKTHGDGTILDDAFRATPGVAVPLDQRGKHTFALISFHDFDDDESGIDEM